jgi:hypothetical protein
MLSLFPESDTSKMFSSSCGSERTVSITANMESTGGVTCSYKTDFPQGLE